VEDDAVRKMKGGKAPRKIHTLLLFLGNPKKITLAFRRGPI